MSKPHKISPEVKQEIIRKVKEEGISVNQAAKDYGVHETSIYNWLSDGLKGTPSWGDYARLKKERDELLRLVGELTVRLSTSQKKTW